MSIVNTDPRKKTLETFDLSRNIEGKPQPMTVDMDMDLNSAYPNPSLFEIQVATTTGYLKTLGT